jgi:hypothetical protein
MWHFRRGSFMDKLTSQSRRQGQATARRSGWLLPTLSWLVRPGKFQTAAAVALNALGAGLILVAFQTFSAPNWKVGADGQLCSGALSIQGTVFTSGPQPGCDNATPLVLVRTDTPWLFDVAISLMVIGAAWQIVLVLRAP